MKDNMYIYILLMNKIMVMKRRRIGRMLNSLDDGGIMIEMITEIEIEMITENAM